MNHRRLCLTVPLATVFLATVAMPAGAADYEPGSPSTYLFDTGVGSPSPWSTAALAAKQGWTLVPEDDVTHVFRGDAVAVNDRLVLVVRRKGAGAELYGVSPAGPRRRAGLDPRLSPGGAAAVSALRILENTPGAVMLAVTFTDESGSGVLKYRLTAGQAIAEVRPTEGVQRLRIDGAASHVVVPDFFGDDMVFQASAMARPRVRLPAENFFLNLVDQGSAQVMCVWQSRKQEAAAIRSAPGEAPAIAGCEVQSAKDKAIWVAVLEGAELWHGRTVTAAEARTELTLAWKPPFPAKWRVDLLGPDGAARSWYFRASDDPAELPPAAGRRHPCCLEAGSAVVRLDEDKTGRPEWPYPAPLVVYAMDRTRATPLTTFCPIDVLRNTLGVGPCQYILQSEGLASDTNPTPDNVMTWVEKQFSRKKQKKAGQEIRDLLDQMVEHLGHAQARIEQYDRLGHDVRDLCKSLQPESRGTGTAALLTIADDLVQATSQAAAAPGPVAQARKLTDEVVALVGKPDSLAECQRLGGQLRAVGAVQDRTLANCRMKARWLRQSAAMAAEDAPADAGLAEKIRARTDQALQTQEAPAER